jgi:branched-chain amino acid aminotransferase
MTPFVYFNGDVVAADSVRLYAADRGLLVGEGAFETMRSYGGRIFRLRAHVSRLFSTLRWLDLELPESPNRLAEVASEVLRRNELADARIRITITAGPQATWVDEVARQPTRLVEAQPVDALPAEAYRQGVPVMTHTLAHGMGMVSGRKTISYLGHVLARRAATRAGAAEAILVGSGQEVVEGAMSNVFVVRDGGVYTPPLSDGSLAGITRQVVLELLAELELEGGEQHLHVSDLQTADEVFLTSSVAEVLPVISVDGRLVGDGRPGAVSQRLLAAYGALV